MIRMAFAAAALSALAACASAPQQNVAGPDGQRDCFRNENVSGYSVTGDRTLRVDVGPSRAYALTTESSLQSARREIQLGLQTGSGFICEGDALNVRIQADGPPQRTWQVIRVERLPEEAPVEGS